MNLAHRPSRRQIAAALLAPLLSTTLLLGSTSDSAQAAEPGSEAPRILAEQTEFDLGQVIRGDVGEATFTLRNTGNAPLRIDRVRPG